MNKISLLIIDAQNDFHANGSLAVSGADEDSQRVAAMIMSHLDKIEEVYVTKDTHNPDHIAHAVFWSSTPDGTGDKPHPFDRISAADIKNGKWYPVDRSLEDHCLEYTTALEEKGRFQLTIWPPHCLIGTSGHDIVPCIQRALDAWTTASGKAINVIEKGQNNYTEMYSAIEAEVPIPSDPRTGTNTAFMAKLKASHKLVICGQAMSHCVNYTTRDVLKNWDPRNTADIVLLLDGCSAVYGCQADADQFVEDMRQSGITLSNTQKVFSK